MIVALLASLLIGVPGGNQIAARFTGGVSDSGGTVLRLSARRCRRELRGDGEGFTIPGRYSAATW